VLAKNLQVANNPPMQLLAVCQIRIAQHDAENRQQSMKNAKGKNSNFCLFAFMADIESEGKINIE
jgi:hypothetical protein